MSLKSDSSSDSGDCRSGISKGTKSVLSSPSPNFMSPIVPFDPLFFSSNFRDVAGRQIIIKILFFQRRPAYFVDS